MKRRRKRIPKLDPSTGDDSAALHEVITAMMKAEGRGGLTAMSERLGTGSPSTLRKKLANPKRAFDEVTMRAVLLVAGSKVESAPESEIIATQAIGSYVIEIRDVDGTRTPFWRTTDEHLTTEPPATPSPL